MDYRSIVLALITVAGLAAAPAGAADRNYSIGSFERIRVDGAFEVKLTTGKSPAAIVQEKGLAQVSTLPRLRNSATKLSRLIQRARKIFERANLRR